jgi:hypothetical protein
MGAKAGGVRRGNGARAQRAENKKGQLARAGPSMFVAEWTGLEPATPGVTGRGQSSTTATTYARFLELGALDGPSSGAASRTRIPKNSKRVERLLAGARGSLRRWGVLLLTATITNTHGSCARPGRACQDIDQHDHRPPHQARPITPGLWNQLSQIRLVRPEVGRNDVAVEADASGPSPAHRSAASCTSQFLSTSASLPSAIRCIGTSATVFRRHRPDRHQYTREPASREHTSRGSRPTNSRSQMEIDHAS